MFDKFYPVSETIRNNAGEMWQVGLTIKIQDHLNTARQGDRERESRLINRLGQLRRNMSSPDDLSPDLRSVIKEAVSWLRSTGRKVDFSDPDPRFWVTARDGKSPRW